MDNHSKHPKSRFNILSNTPSVSLFPWNVSRFNAYTLSISFGLKGLAFSFIYNIIFNLLFIIFLIFILIKLFYIGKLTLGYLIYRKIEIVKYIKRNYLAITIITILVLTNDIFLHFFSTNILKMLTNML